MLRLVVCLLSVLLLPASGFCAIYGYMDADGVYHMTNIRPPNRKFQVFIEDRVPALSTSSVRALSRNAYDHLIRQHAQAHGIDPHLVKAVMMAESAGNPRALSHKGAQGLMQIMPETAQFLSLRDPFDPEESIQAGARYLKILHELFNGNLELVLAAYNAGPQRVMQHNMTVPPISETINYVKKVKLFYSRLKDSQ